MCRQLVYKPIVHGINNNPNSLLLPSLCPLLRQIPRCKSTSSINRDHCRCVFLQHAATSSASGVPINR